MRGPRGLPTWDGWHDRDKGRKRGTSRVAIIIVGRLGRKSGPNGPQ